MATTFESNAYTTKFPVLYNKPTAENIIGLAYMKILESLTGVEKVVKVDKHKNTLFIFVLYNNNLFVAKK